MNDNSNILNMARTLIQEQKYDSARMLLETIRDDPEARRLLSQLEHIAKRGAMLPQRQDTLTGEDAKRKNEDILFEQGEKPKVVVTRPPQVTGDKDYTGMAVITLFAYWVFWPAGLVLNILQYNEARGYERATGFRAKGMGCLTALLLVHVILPLALCGLVLCLVVASGPSLENFIEQVNATLEAQR